MKIELIADEYAKLDIVPRSTVCSIKPTLFSVSDYCSILRIADWTPIVPPQEIFLIRSCLTVIGKNVESILVSNSIKLFLSSKNACLKKMESKHVPKKCGLNAINSVTLIIIEGKICYSFFDLLKRKTQFADRGMKLKKFSVIYLERFAMLAA